MNTTYCYRCGEAATTTTTTGSAVCDRCQRAAQEHADNLAAVAELEAGGVRRRRRCRCGGSGWVADLTWCGDEDCCPQYLNCLRCNPEGRGQPPGR